MGGTTYNNDRLDYDLLLGPDHYKKAALTFMKKMWGRFTAFGQAMAGFMVILFIITFLKLIFTQFLACFDVYKRERKVSWKMITGFLPFIARSLVLHGHSNDIQKLQWLLSRLISIRGSDEEAGAAFKSLINRYGEKFGSQTNMTYRHQARASAPTNRMNRSRSPLTKRIPLGLETQIYIQPEINNNWRPTSNSHLGNNIPQIPIINENLYLDTRSVMVIRSTNQVNSITNGLEATLMLTISIDGRKARALIDTGANISVVHSRFLPKREIRAILKKNKTNKKEIEGIKVADGAQMNVFKKK